MDIDPEYVAANRKKGIMTDNQELGMVESSMAYGVTVGAATATNVFPISLVALPDKPSKLVFDAAGRPRLLSVLNGQEAYLTAVYVEATDNWIGLPSVHHVDISGQLLDGTAIVERIKK